MLELHIIMERVCTIVMNGMVDGDAGRRNCQVFGSYQPVLNTPVLTILWGDNLMDNDDVINLSSACLAKLRGLLFHQHFQPDRPAPSIIFQSLMPSSMECRSETRNKRTANSELTERKNFHPSLPCLVMDRTQDSETSPLHRSPRSRSSFTP